MNNMNVKSFRELFDPVLFGDGFVRRFDVYWHIDLKQAWYCALWGKKVGQGFSFDIEFDFGALWQLMPEVLKKKRFSTDFSLRNEFSQQTKQLFTLWAIPQDFAAALDLYQQKAKTLFHSLYSLHDIYNLERKLHHSDVITLSDGVRWIDLLLWNGEIQKAVSLIPPMRKWVEGLLKNTIEDSEKYRIRIEKWNENGPLTKQILFYEPEIYKTELERLPQRMQRLKEIRDQIDVIEQSLCRDHYQKRLEEIRRLLDVNTEYINKVFSKKELEWMKDHWSEVS